MRNVYLRAYKRWLGSGKSAWPVPLEYCHVRLNIASMWRPKPAMEVTVRFKPCLPAPEVKRCQGPNCPIKAHPTSDPKGLGVACPVHVVPNRQRSIREKVGRKFAHGCISSISVAPTCVKSWLVSMSLDESSVLTGGPVSPTRR